MVNSVFVWATQTVIFHQLEKEWAYAHTKSLLHMYTYAGDEGREGGKAAPIPNRGIIFPSCAYV